MLERLAETGRISGRRRRGRRPGDDAHTLRDDPLWYKDAVIYQVHVKSFFDANGDGVGDFEGLIAKLDYIASLGVTAVWLLPFYPSPRRDDGYDISDYEGVHPDYGTLRDARRFIAEAHRRGLRVITELVINHTSDQHPWFQRARRAPKGSWQRDFYVWRDDDKGFPDTRIIFLDAETSNWAWDEVAQAYYWHRFYSHQPDLNFDNPRVLRAVLRAMRFWLRAGVDGLRLDAVPYLVEREGTNNENLPETHAVIRRIRAELDAHWPGRMLLAEANQWPEDARHYFGAGDECHMAFHFPLMPRMYMALAVEDRYPITDILRQTPPIPETCQWAIFLRNHDELTLEMVTDAERDVLWNTYAADPRARLNLGIRRRLAPLLDNDRRRIELLNSLLLSMPGTPVIYYGDEIGMGDNIFLGDRDGVRTPMQWSPDRSGGFSRADPARLVLPPIMDPVYGYQAVNVEAQSRNPHSLLNWTRRMLSVRSERAATFGRGGYRQLYPANRTILAYLREHEGDTVLCVANLSRRAQAVELDLGEFRGAVPVELLGRSPFPPIGALPYLLTLPPYGFFWFVLAQEQEAPSWHVATPAMLPEFVTVVLRDDFRPAFEREARTLFEEQVLPAYLPRRPWYRPSPGRQRPVRVVSAPALRTAEGDVLLAELAHEQGSEHYLLPLALVFEPEDRVLPLSLQLALARARRGRRVGLVTDAFSRDAFARAMLAALREGRVLADDAGEIRFRPAPGLAEIDCGVDAPVRRTGLEVTQSSLVIGEEVVLKLVRRSRPGPHPEIAMTRHLSAAGFASTPAFLGDVVRVSPEGSERVLAFAQAFLRNQGNGWDWTLAQLARLFDDAQVADPPRTPAEHLSDAGAGSLGFLAALGRHLGEMHAVLAAPSDDPDFAPLPVTDEHLAALRGEAKGLLAETLDALEQRLAGREEPAAAPLRPLPALRRALAAKLRVPPASRAGLRLRVHGALGLEQVLVIAGDAAIVGFGGDPTCADGLRAARSSPARDLAALLVSLDLALAAATAALPPSRAGAEDPRPALAEAWARAARDAFLGGWRSAAADAPWAPRREGDLARLIDLFAVAEACLRLRHALAADDIAAAQRAAVSLTWLAAAEQTP